MIYITCSICGFKFSPKYEEEARAHRNWHNFYLVIEKKYAGHIIHPSNWKGAINEGKQLVNSGRNTFEGGKILAEVAFTRYLLNTQKHIALYDFLEQKSDNEIHPDYVDAVLFYREQIKL